MKFPFWQSSASGSKSRLKAAHMTFARSSIGKSITSTGLLLKRQMWIWPIVAFLVLSVVGYFVRSAIESTMKNNLQSQLQTLLRVETSMLENWYGVQASSAQFVANTPTLRRLANQLLSPQSGDAPQPIDEILKVRSAIGREMAPMLDNYDFEGYVLFDRNQQIIASNNEELVGMKEIPQFEAFLKRVCDGETVVSTPVMRVTLVKDESGALRSGAPTMFAAAPVRDENLQVVGVLALRIQPEKEFTRILHLGQIGETGETYAFDRKGLMVSNSRFDNELVLMGLLPDQPLARSILTLLIRDPGGDMTQGFRPKVRRSEMPMTKMVQQATSGKDGYDLEGYNDYRGVTVVGAWAWLPKHEVGIATEIDKSEAYGPLNILSRVFAVLYILLIIASVAIFIFTLVVGRMHRQAQKAAVEALELGQYKLEQKLGAGAMGVVYKGYHAMMRRPTAIKLLNIEGMTPTAISRFEHEVQITSQLNHPNTIAIYDYGRTPEGVFYYAMEYLDGIDLQTLVDQYGPQPEARVIQIMLQICGSLYEAHAQGLVHRDIKPANIMLNRRGGEPDVIKVLDFGLVKQIDADKKQADKDAGMAGTPLYLSPEAIQSPSLVDACSDLYAVGAVGYFLITGKTVFDATSIIDLLQKHVTEMPVPPSQRAPIDISQEFEDTLLSCLEKSRSRRPQTARDLSQLLRRCQPKQTWSIHDADTWWNNHERRNRVATATTVAGNSSVQLPQLPNMQSLTKPAATDSPTSDSAKDSVKGSANESEPSTGNSTATNLDQTIWHEPEA